MNLEFDGWVRTNLLKDKPTFLGVLREDEIRPTHRTKKGARLLLNKVPTAAEVAEATPVVVARIDEGIAEVAVAGLWGVTTDALYLQEEDIVPIVQP